MIFEQGRKVVPKRPCNVMLLAHHLLVRNASVPPVLSSRFSKLGYLYAHTDLHVHHELDPAMSFTCNSCQRQPLILCRLPIRALLLPRGARFWVVELVRSCRPASSQRPRNSVTTCSPGQLLEAIDRPEPSDFASDGSRPVRRLQITCASSAP